MFAVTAVLQRNSEWPRKLQKKLFGYGIYCTRISTVPSESEAQTAAPLCCDNTSAIQLMVGIAIRQTAETSVVTYQSFEIGPRLVKSVYAVLPALNSPPVFS